MGKLIIFAAYYFFVWAGENPSERLHVHVFCTNSKNSFGAKFWLDDLSLFERGDFSDKELNQIRRDLTLSKMKNRLVNIKFPKGYIELYLENGLIVKAPVRLFPEIQKLPAKDRQNWQILDGVGFTFQKSDAGFHLRQFGLQ